MGLMFLPIQLSVTRFTRPGRQADIKPFQTKFCLQQDTVCSVLHDLSLNILTAYAVPYEI